MTEDLMDFSLTWQAATAGGYASAYAVIPVRCLVIRAVFAPNGTYTSLGLRELTDMAFIGQPGIDMLWWVDNHQNNTLMIPLGMILEQGRRVWMSLTAGGAATATCSLHCKRLQK